jgi:oxygen-independent coproporphyrinogen-3 oxidase
MAGIYIHIPFCKKACHYCNFHFSTSFGKKDELIHAIAMEVDLQKGYLEGQTINTIYFGGGTPSAIPADDIETILKTIRDNFHLSHDAEITLEANPDDIENEILQEWKSIGINRLSIGLQALQDDLLRAWNRNHSADQARNAIRLSQKHGFDNITADLIYGGAGLTDENWRTNVQFLIDSGIPHISCYALTVEPGTALAYQIDKGKIIAPEDEQGNRQYALLQEMLSKAGFQQYEVSNFSMPEMESKHNTSYWSGTHYLGLGPSAHSFNGKSRQWNIQNNIQYIDALQKMSIPFEIEVLTVPQQFNELVMTGLRTSFGIDAKRLGSLGNDFSQYLENEILHHQHQLQKTKTGNWALKPEFYFFADGIAAELFYSS